MKLTAILAVARSCLWTRASANWSAPTILSHIATPRSALCLRVSWKRKQNFECETLSPLHHRFCCNLPRVPKKPRKQVLLKIVWGLAEIVISGTGAFLLMLLYLSLSPLQGSSTGESPSTHTVLVFLPCRRGCNSSLDACKRRIGVHCVYTICKHWRAVLLVKTEFVFHSDPCLGPQAVHSLQNNHPRDTTVLPGESNFLSSWYRVRKWQARSCCLGDNNGLSLIRWRRWRCFQRSWLHFHFLWYILYPVVFQYL